MKKNYFKSLMQAAVLVCTPLVIASCDDVFGDTDNPIPAYMSIKQSDINLVLHKDSLDKATATRTAIAATGAEVVYSSSNEKVATVDAKTGVITAVGGGKCDIIAEVTGKDSNGRDTYQPQKASFTVNVKDYRARVKFAEESAIVNSALIKNGVFKMKNSEVYPAAGCTVSYTHNAATGSTDPIYAINPDGSITLNAENGKAVITAEITAVPDGYEMKSFKDANGKVKADFTLEVKEGVAYISGYDATGKPDTTYMYKDYNGEKYIDLATKLTGSADVTLDAGWYYLKTGQNFGHNIRVKGDVNIILGRGQWLSLYDGTNQFSVLDESAKQTYKLNFFTQPAEASGDPGEGGFSALRIKDFKEVNLSGGAWVYSPIDAVENVNINRGGMPYGMTGTGNVNVTEGFAGTWDTLKGFASVTVAKAKNANGAGVGALNNVASAIISENAYAGTISNVTTLTVDKASSVGNMNTIETLTINKAGNIGNLNTIGTAVITETPTKGLSNITTLTLNKVNPAGTSQLYRIGTVAINKLSAAASFSSITANTLNISDGTVVVNGKIAGFKKVSSSWVEQDAKVTVTGGKLTVNGPAGDVYAILGDVTVSGGEFKSISPNYHAVSGALVGTFEGSTDGTTWTDITGAERPKYIRNKVAE